jgi:predicted phage baseplate assembly protein
VGASEGVPGQRFLLKRRPVVPGDRPTVVRVADDEEGWLEWTQVADFSESGRDDRHFVLDAVGGEIAFGPAVREADGTLRSYGGVPPKGARVRVDVYLTGGGRRGNLAPRAISVLKSSIPYVRHVENRAPMTGGVDGEEIENAKVRGPITLRTRGRAVTTEDFEHLAREVAPELARVRAVAAGDGADAGSVRVLVVPSAPAEAGRLRFEQLVPSEETLARVAARLEETRVIGTRVIVEPPVYRGITIVARLRPRPRVTPARLQAEALAALYGYFNPITGGPQGTGWPFGRPIQVGEVFAVLQRIRGTEIVEDVRLFGADPITGQRGQATQRLDLESHALVFSYEHQLLVEEG